MCADMVLAYGRGAKSQTRRVIKNWQEYGCLTGDCPHERQAECDQYMAGQSRFGGAGDGLWIKETWRPVGPWECRKETVQYRADGVFLRKTGWPKTFRIKNSDRKDKWKPSIFMPMWASRYRTAIVSVRAEQLQDITEADAKAEGCKKGYSHNGGGIEIEANSNYRCGYRELWNELNLKPNPFYITDEFGKKNIASYLSYPWSDADFDRLYPGALKAGLWRGKPLTVEDNPHVWRIEFESHKK